MSDSDDLLPSNIYSFQSESTAVCAKGPNINSANITGLSFRNNVLTSSMHMPRTFDRPRYTELSFDQRSIPCRRETSPMSMYSDMRTRNFHNSIYHSRMSSQRSMYNGRSGSPMSMRSIDSNTTVSAADIASALKNLKFNTNDLKMIKDAYNKLMKRRIRKRIEKRRNMRLFLKGNRRKSGYDSGEQGSNSSVSSDDCRSTHSLMYRNNASSYRSTRTDIADFNQSIKESNMYKDCTNTLKNKAFKNIFSIPPSHIHRDNNDKVTQNSLKLNQKQRFENGFLLPSQRFNKSVVSIPIPENCDIQVKPTSWDSRGMEHHVQISARNNNCETDTDQEEIFSEVTVHEKSIQRPVQQETENKRCLEFGENECPKNKRTKLSSPEKQSRTGGKHMTNDKCRNLLNNDKNKDINKNGKTDDFQFLKPQFPIRKSGTNKFKDKLISKSAAPFTDVIIQSQNTIPEQADKFSDNNEPNKLSPVNNSTTAENIDEKCETISNSISDMSMRPSFIKRKLFSQKMCLTEKKNLSSEVLNVDSPQNNVYSHIQREKHKTRKVVTNQSCLNRDVLDDNNLLELIHKIVPPDQMNITNMTNKTSTRSKPTQEDKYDEDDKWDVTSIVSTCNKDDISETYTDEEIFHDNKKKKDIGKVSKPINSSKVLGECKVLVKRSLEVERTTKADIQISKPTAPKNVGDNRKCIKSFWDTDFESDLESPRPKCWGEQNKETNDNTNINLLQSKKSVTEKHSPNVQDTNSLSERFRLKPNNSMLEKSVGNSKKYNINRNLTINIFGANKNKIIDQKMNSSANVALPTSKNKQINRNKHKDTDIKIKQTEIVTNGERNESGVNNIRKETKKKSPPNSKHKRNKKNNIAGRQEETADKLLMPITQNKVENNLQKPKLSERLQKVDADIVATRTPRTPKKKSAEKMKLTEKNQEGKDTKLNSSRTSTKSKNTNEKENAGKKHGKQPVKNKENVVPAQVFVGERNDRTLRSRKIDLSSSLNTSNEDMKNITIRSLRTRRIDLSSSINNSSLEVNSIVTSKKVHNSSDTKTIVKSNQNDIRKGRAVKKNSTKS